MAAGDGLIVMTPTSIDVTGTSGSINADGGVDFTAVTSLSLNGVFTSSYDNYLIVYTATSASVIVVTFRLRVAGTDASGSNYTSQELVASDTYKAGTRFSSETSSRGFYSISSTPSGITAHIYGPALAQATAMRTVSHSSDVGAVIADYAVTHSLATSYDGFTLGATTAITGNITVFGYEE